MWAGGRLRSPEALRRRRLRRLESLATSSTGACGPSSLWPPRAVAAAAAVRLGASAHEGSCSSSPRAASHAFTQLEVEIIDEFHSWARKVLLFMLQFIQAQLLTDGTGPKALKRESTSRLRRGRCMSSRAQDGTVVRRGCMLFHISGMMAMLAMLHHHQRRVTPSRSNDQNLGGTERHFCARSEGRKLENRIMLAMLHHHQRRVTPSSSNDQDLGGTERHFCTRSESRK